MTFPYPGQMVRPPAPELPPAERLRRERQEIFRSYVPGQVQHGVPPDPRRQHQPASPDIIGPVEKPEVCVLDERGGHRQLGYRCPHFAGFNRDEVIEVSF
jgi:hypothetical protein